MFGRKKKLDTDKLFETCMHQETTHRLKATDISTYIKSPFQLYCNKFADSKERDQLPDQYLKSLAVAGVKHEEDINSEQFPDAISVKYDTPEEGFMMAIDAMTKGVPAFLGASLFYLPNGMYGDVDQLVRVKGKSIFGSHHYIIKEIKIARNIKKQHILQAAFYNHIIGKIQGYTPDTFYILNMDNKEQGFAFSEYKEELFQTIQKINDILEGNAPSPTFGSCSYPWNDYCNKMALESKDISLIGGISLKKKESLASHGIKNLEDILNLNESQLMEIRGIGSKTAQKYLWHAKSLSENKLLRKSKPIPLPMRSTEIFLDLEGLDIITTEILDNAQTDYLIGVLVRSGDDEKYISFVAEDHNKEEEMLNEFLDFIKKQKDYVIYHWHHYEKTHLAKMMEKYRTPQKDRDLVLADDVLFDLHPITTKQFAFPIPSTSIKAIAKWMGFSWKHQDVGAMNSIELYLQYVRESDEVSLNLILDYNKDDCEATMIIKDWLIKQKDQL